MYILWNGRVGGWLTSAATYSSDLAEAQHFMRVDAITLCRAHRDALGNAGMIPCRLEDAEAVRD